MNESPLAVLLADFQRAGITDIASDMPFDMRTDKIYPLEQAAYAQKEVKDHSVGNEMSSLTSALQEKKAPRVDAPKAVATEKSAQTAPVSDVSAPDVSVPVWAFGVEEPRVAVLISADVAKETAPLSGNAQKLFAKMMSAIELGASDVVFLVMQEQDTITQNMCDDVRAKLGEFLEEMSPAALLAVGRTMQKIVTDDVFCGKPCIPLEHPATLLAHPLFKKKAWHALLKLKQNMPSD